MGSDLPPVVLPFLLLAGYIQTNWGSTAINIFPTCKTRTTRITASKSFFRCMKYGEWFHLPFSTLSKLSDYTYIWTKNTRTSQTFTYHQTHPSLYEPNTHHNYRTFAPSQTPSSERASMPQTRPGTLITNQTPKAKPLPHNYIRYYTPASTKWVVYSVCLVRPCVRPCVQTVSRAYLPCFFTYCNET